MASFAWVNSCSAPQETILLWVTPQCSWFLAVALFLWSPAQFSRKATCPIEIEQNVKLSIWGHWGCRIPWVLCRYALEGPFWVLFGVWKVVELLFCFEGLEVTHLDFFLGSSFMRLLSACCTCCIWYLWIIIGLISSCYNNSQAANSYQDYLVTDLTSKSYYTSWHFATVLNYFFFSYC